MQVSALPGAEFMAQDEVASLQKERWAAQAAYVSGCSAFYARHFGAGRLRGQMEELADLPAVLQIFRCAVQRRHVWRGRAYVRSRDGSFELDGGTR